MHVMQSKDADPERFFGKLKERMQRYIHLLASTHQGCICVLVCLLNSGSLNSCVQNRSGMCRAEIDLASVEVRFQNLSIDADIAVGSRGEPTVLNAYRNKLEVNAFLTIGLTYILLYSKQSIECLLCTQHVA